MMSKFQSFDNLKFVDYFPTIESWREAFADMPQVDTLFQSEDTLDLIWYLLIPRYGYSTISSYSQELFPAMVWSKIWQYGPTWEKRVQIQEKLRSLGLDADSEIYRGTKSIYNSAFNDSSAPSTQTLEELTYINNQNTTNIKRSTLEGLSTLAGLLETDVTEEFLSKFASLFKKIIYSGDTLLYTTYEGETL